MSPTLPKTRPVTAVVRRNRKAPRVVKRSTRALAAVRGSAAQYAPLVGFLAVTTAAAAYGSQFNPTPRNPDTELWYAAQKTSRFNPPPAVRGPVWAALYGMIAVAGWRVYRAPRSRARSEALVWWAAQMSLNAAWTPLFFGERKPRAALADLVALTGAIGGFTASARKVDRGAAALMIPYLGWVTFAGYLNAEIVRLNRPVTERHVIAALEGV
ncbi:MAG: TspO/MBR family protein [Gemmatimonadetes bacterium]|nr:TspO/MBR family protein [Gemmatimonadota bacterium]